MATAKDDLGDKLTEAAGEATGESSSAGDDVLVVEGNTTLSLADKNLVVKSERTPRALRALSPANQPRTS